MYDWSHCKEAVIYVLNIIFSFKKRINVQQLIYPKRSKQSSLEETENPNILADI